ncbi:hypothetical protein T440DRAFT_500157 [Plenodomus tracheiphilus IPT5]|uniref:ClpP/crotonase n=1 Tax=Plenodomus tracheiphilus IPT5 TaxID=1408161 RepID=A0A6A7B1Q0_9PLEO|nr:hypothetical protein T440DRAFT_500157 [Plenodomus tracheiphilus IPT5]
MAECKYWNFWVDRYDRVFVITMQTASENRLNVKFAQEIIHEGNDENFWSTGLELDEADTNPFANSDGFFRYKRFLHYLLATLLDCPFPTSALLTGHIFGGACPFSCPSHHEPFTRFFSMPPVDLGLHFPGFGFLPRLKLRPQIARNMLLEAHRWTGKEAYEDGIDVALRKARQVQGKAKMAVYSVLRNELWGEAAEKIRGICYVYGRMVTAPAKAKIWSRNRTHSRISRRWFSLRMSCKT